MTIKRWTTEEDDFLRSNRVNMTEGQLAKALGRTAHAVNNRVRKAGMSKEFSKARKHWSAEELAFVQDNINTMSTRKIAEALGRKFEAVVHKLHISDFNRTNYVKEYGDELRVDKRWTEEDLAKLHQFAGRMPIEDLAKEVGHSVKTVRHKSQKLGLSTNVDCKPWTEKEINWKQLSEMYSMKSAARSTGYATTQLKRAKKMLRQTWARYGLRFVISQRQLDEMTEWLKWEDTEWKAKDAA